MRRKLTNLLILSPKETMEQPPLILDTLTKRQLLTLIHTLLTRQHGNATEARDLLRRLNRLFHQLVLTTLDHLRRNTPLTGLLAAEHLARQDDLHGLALANGTGEALRRARAGDHTELDLGLAERGAGGAVEDVAHEGELAAAAEGVAGDGGDDGFADIVGEVGPGGDEVLGVGGGEG